MHDEDPSVYPFQDWGSPTGKEYKVLLFTLPAIAGLSGATIRITNSFMTQVIGGRNVVFHTSIMLTASMILTAWALQSKTAPFNILLVSAWLSGVGGAAFGSSMSNISFYYPKAEQGYALGMNGGLGNLGVSMTQLLVPLFMSMSFGKEPLSDKVDGWPNHAGWLWWPFCFICSIAAFFWMSNHPDHGNHPEKGNEFLWNTIYYYWFEGQALLVSSVVILVLVFSRDTFRNSEGGKIAHSFVLVAISFILSHTALKFLSPPAAKEQLQQQFEMFNNKHTYIMTFLYTMSFGSFIGFSGAFPLLINSIFGYITADGCYYQADSYRPYSGNDVLDGEEYTSIWVDKHDDSRIFVKGGTERDCYANGGDEWGHETVTNPNAPNVFAFSWLGACVGSLIRPVGGILADYNGGAKVTQVLIIWCTVATICLAILIQKTSELEQPELNFGLFVFLFLNVFFCTGAMNGTTFRTIGVLFDYKLAGTVCGWSSSIGAYGAFVIPSMFSVSINVGRPETTLYCLAAYYVVCAGVNHYYYARPNAERPGV